MNRPRYIARGPKTHPGQGHVLVRRSWRSSGRRGVAARAQVVVRRSLRRDHGGLAVARRGRLLTAWLAAAPGHRAGAIGHGLALDRRGILERDHWLGGHAVGSRSG